MKTEYEIGETVIVTGRYGDGVATIHRLTKTQIITENDRFNRETGRRVGAGTWDICYIRKATPEKLESIRDAAKRRGIITLIGRTNWKELPTDKLEQVEAIIKTHQEQP